MRSENDLHELVKIHFPTEDFGVKACNGDLESSEVHRAVFIMEKTMKRIGIGYEIGLLSSSDDVKFPDSYAMGLLPWIFWIGKATT